MTENNEDGRDRHKKIALPGNAKAAFWLERLGGRVEARESVKTPDGSSESSAGGWQRCSQLGCLGEALPNGSCLAHSNSAARQEHFIVTAQSGSPLSLKGLTISQPLWDEIVASRIFVEGAPCVPISFAAAEINARIRITRRTLSHGLDFTGASVFEFIELTDCVLKHALVARFGIFNGGGFNCAGCNFLHIVDISFSRTEKVSNGFERCSFEEQFIADGASGSLQLGKSKFAKLVSLKYATGVVILDDAHVLGGIEVRAAAFDVFRAEKLVAESANRIGPCKIKSFMVPRATFRSRVHIDLESDSVDLSGAMFTEGGLIDVQANSVQLSEVTVGNPLRVSGKVKAAKQTEIRSLRNADAGKMSFARVDLSRCSFYGAHGLSNIDIESTVTLSISPWWAGARRYIADEFAWRSGAGNLHSRGWNIEGVHVGTEQPSRVKGAPEKILLPALDAVQVAAIYRELRRSLESKSDMPGAADFYYGEMEMRRWSAPLPERVLLWLYWVISGYGMRAWRALACWIALIALGTFLIKFNGFESAPYSISRALLFSIRASLPGIVTLEDLTPTGQGVEIGLRIFGPLTIALFLIAVRGKLIRKPSD